MTARSTDTVCVVRRMTGSDWPAVSRIYAEGIVTGDATFEAAPPDWEAFDAAKLDDHRFVACDTQGRVVGWVAVAPTSARPCYRGVVEHSVFVDASARGQGVGRLLLETLISSTEAAGIWTLSSGIFPENTGSRRLHQACGFRETGRSEAVGRMVVGPAAGRWRDVIHVERRSPVVW